MTPPPPPQYAAPAGATQAFAIPSMPQMEAPGAQQGPSEYTRMMAAASIPSASDPAAPAAPGYPHMPHMPQANMPGMPQANMSGMPHANMPAMPHAYPPQMPGMAQPAMPRPPAPQFPMPAAQVPLKAPSQNLLLYAILALLMFLVGGFIVYLLMRH